VNVLIAGAAGNLGSLLTKHLLSSPHHPRLLTHKRALPFDLPPGANAEIVRGDLNDPASLRQFVKTSIASSTSPAFCSNRIRKSFCTGQIQSTRKTLSMRR
jgi:hypothetical protein